MPAPDAAFSLRVIDTRYLVRVMPRCVCRQRCHDAVCYVRASVRALDDSRIMLI